MHGARTLESEPSPVQDLFLTEHDPESVRYDAITRAKHREMSRENAETNP